MPVAAGASKPARRHPLAKGVPAPMHTQESGFKSWAIEGSDRRLRCRGRARGILQYPAHLAILARDDEADGHSSRPTERSSCLSSDTGHSEAPFEHVHADLEPVRQDSWVGIRSIGDHEALARHQESS